MDKSHVELPKEVKPFGSGNIAPGNSYEHAFNHPGIYQYFCIPDEGSGMIGQVIVTGKNKGLNTLR